MAIANPERGEVEVVVKRKDKEGNEAEKTYTLKMSMNAAATVQARTKKTIGQLLADAVTLDFFALREIVFLLLQKHHRDEIKTAEAAGDFIDDAGGVGIFFDKLQELGTLNNAGTSPGVGDATPNPQTADGNLDASSATPVGSV